MTSGIEETQAEPDLRGSGLPALVHQNETLEASLVGRGVFLKLVFGNIREGYILARVGDLNAQDIVFVPVLAGLPVSDKLNLKGVRTAVAYRAINGLLKPLLLKSVAGFEVLPFGKPMWKLKKFEF